MRLSFSILLALVFNSVLFAQEDQSIYNDDPMQKLPLGVEEAHHRFISAEGGTVDRPRVEPPNWWVGMYEPTLEILIYDQDIKGSEVSLDYAGVTMVDVTEVQNPNYLFLKIHIGRGTAPGTFDIRLTKAGAIKTYPYELRQRRRDATDVQGLSSADLIYLIMPDRFANGDPENDTDSSTRQQGTNRDKIFFRHGGDLLGVMEHLDYVEDLGATAIWLNPVLENDQPYESYHGYAITDHYRIDPRLGSNEQYRQFVQLCHQRGLKVIMDIIHNHTGDQHWLIRDLPAEDWIHQWEEFTRPIYRSSLVMDPYAAPDDRRQLLDGWFDKHMPDLNQQNEQVANYLIQNNIWWTEFSGHDGYRVDTYFYPDPEFMARWAKRMQLEFPTLGLFGETWVQGLALQAYFTEDNDLVEGYNAYLPGVTDFQLHFAINEALAQPQSWTGGVARLYYTLAQDFLYEDPYRNVLFLDNHDLTRFYSAMEEDMDKFKSGIALLLTLRGIPMLYYGTEILMTGSGGAFGEGGRRDFPGGWTGDPQNKFSAKGRTEAEQAAFDYVRRLARYRKENPVLQSGRLMQYVPENGIYVYFRYNDAKTVMVVMNSNDRSVEVDTTRYRGQMQGFTGGTDLGSGRSVNDLSQLKLDAHTVLVLELR